MKHRTKQTIAGLLLSATVLGAVSSLPVAEAAFPHAYWQYQDPWIAANASNNYSEIIRLGLIIEGIMYPQPVGDSDRTTMLFNVYEAMTPAYQALGDYAAAVETAKKLIPYAEAKGFTDTVIFAEKYITQMNAMTQVYALSGDTTLAPYFGARYEPQSGAYFGRTQNSAGVFQEESAVSFYVECFQETVAQYDYLISPYSNGSRMIQICLNMPAEGTSMNGILSEDANSYLISMLQYLDGINAPILLRVGGEMNVWENSVDPQVFQNAFRKIANLRDVYAPNVAMVFSPNNISEWGMDIMDFYPGDEYVDWVGMSAYSNKYRDPSNPSNGTFEDNSLYGNNMFYHSGDFTSVIHSIAEVVELFGNRKPILISESGAGYGHKDYTLNLYQFSIDQLNTLYTYANMVFPQIKMIINFDDNVPSDRYYYSMSANPDLLSAYQTVTRNNPTLLSSIHEKNTTNYVKADLYQDSRETLELASFSAPPGVDDLSVSYILNGSPVGSGQAIPYTCSIAVSSLPSGTSNLTVAFAGGNGYYEEKYYLLHRGMGYSLTMEEVGSNDGFGPVENAVIPEVEAPDVLVEPDVDSPSTGYDGKYGDVSESFWGISFVDFAMERGLFPLENGNFYPDTAANRGSTAQALANFCGGDGANLPLDFADAVGTSYASGVAWCVAQGVMSGMGDGVFGTESNLTREQFATTLRSLANHLGVDVLDHGTDLFTFDDVASISGWAFSPLQWAVGEGFMEGADNQLKPQNQISRLEVSIMLKAFGEKYGL